MNTTLELPSDALDRHLKARRIRALAEMITTGESTETYPAEEIAEAREYLRKNGIVPSSDKRL